MFSALEDAGLHDIHTLDSRRLSTELAAGHHFRRNRTCVCGLWSRKGWLIGRPEGRRQGWDRWRGRDRNPLAGKCLTLSAGRARSRYDPAGIACPLCCRDGCAAVSSVQRSNWHGHGCRVTQRLPRPCSQREAVACDLVSTSTTPAIPSLLLTFRPPNHACSTAHKHSSRDQLRRILNTNARRVGGKPASIHRVHGTEPATVRTLRSG